MCSKYIGSPRGPAFKPRNKKRYAPRPKAIDAIKAVIAATFAVSLDELRANTRRAAPVAFARQCAMYLAHVVLGLSCAEVGRLFGRDRTTAAHACRLVEERRDDPLFDALISAMESACQAPSHVMPDSRGR